MDERVADRALKLEGRRRWVTRPLKNVVGAHEYGPTLFADRPAETRTCKTIAQQPRTANNNQSSAVSAAIEIENSGR